jgi:ribosomal protein S12 methylthiotransferase accessory factor
MTSPSLPPDMPAAARAYVDSMPAGRVELFPLTALDVTGVPCWNAIFHDAAARSWVGVAPHGVGYGSTDAEAIIGTTGELAEAVHSAAGIWRMERRRGSHAALARELGEDAVADPLTLCLPAGCAVDGETELEWVAARRWPDGAAVWLPIDIAACSYGDLSEGYEAFTSPTTNGLGAGPTLDFAVGHGLCELFQRDGNGLGFRAMDRGIVLDFAGEDGAETYPRDPRTRALLARLRGLGIDVLPKFASDEFGLCNVYCVGDQPDVEGGGAAFPLMVTAAGEAASLDREHALRKAILEFAAARARKTFSHGPLDRVGAVAPAGYLDDYRARHTLAGEEGRTMAAMRAWLGLDARALRAQIAGSVLRQAETQRFDALPRWDGAMSGTGLVAELHRRLAAAGMAVLVLDWSPPGHPGVHVVKVVVPGLEVETMSYHRIGERGVAKLLARGSPLVGFGPGPAGTRAVRLPAGAAERLGGAPWLDVAEIDRIVGGLYPLYREPEAHSAPIAMEGA